MTGSQNKNLLLGFLVSNFCDSKRNPEKFTVVILRHRNTPVVGHDTGLCMVVGEKGLLVEEEHWKLETRVTEVTIRYPTPIPVSLELHSDGGLSDPNRVLFSGVVWLSKKNKHFNSCFSDWSI